MKETYSALNNQISTHIIEQLTPFEQHVYNAEHFIVNEQSIYYAMSVTDRWKLKNKVHGQLYFELKFHMRDALRIIKTVDI